MWSNAKLFCYAERLLALFSGGEINLDGAGYPGNNEDGFTVELGDKQGRGHSGGGSGGGHGGTGGRGTAQQAVGLGYDSLYEPSEPGAPGGYGSQFGEYPG